MLIDPWSARFEYIATNGRYVCGRVNSKNRMGAYVGYSVFIADADRVARPIILDEMPSVWDYRTWADDPESDLGLRAYDRLEDGCNITETWLSRCGVPWAGQEPPVQLCSAWRAQDFRALEAMR